MPDLDAVPFPDRDLFLDEWRKYGYTLDSPEGALRARLCLRHS